MATGVPGTNSLYDVTTRESWFGTYTRESFGLAAGKSGTESDVAPLGDVGQALRSASGVSGQFHSGRNALT